MGSLVPHPWELKALPTPQISSNGLFFLPTLLSTHARVLVNFFENIGKIMHFSFDGEIISTKESGMM